PCSLSSSRWCCSSWKFRSPLRRCASAASSGIEGAADGLASIMRGALWRLPAMWMLIAYTLCGFTGFFVTISALPAWLALQGTAESLTGLVTSALLIVTVLTQIMMQHLKRLLGLTTTLAVGAVALGAPSLL